MQSGLTHPRTGVGSGGVDSQMVEDRLPGVLGLWGFGALGLWGSARAWEAWILGNRLTFAGRVIDNKQRTKASGGQKGGSRSGTEVEHSEESWGETKPLCSAPRRTRWRCALS